MDGKKRGGPELPHPHESLKKIRERRHPDPWEETAKLAHVKHGRFCGRCKHFVDKKVGQEELRRDNFWERVFHAHDDGTDLKPHHIGDTNAYSICSKRGCAAHEHSTCEHWEAK